MVSRCLLDVQRGGRSDAYAVRHGRYKISDNMFQDKEHPFMTLFHSVLFQGEHHQVAES